MTFGDLPAGKYGAILADPPWNFSTWSGKGRDRCADKHYDVLSFERICALPVIHTAAKDCVLFLWVTDPMLERGLTLIREWGFTYKTVGFYWTKRNLDRTPFMGNGYWTRANPEQCLLATKGKPKRLSKSVRRWIDSARREHSRKPDEQYESIERLVGGPYLELFARTKRRGWDAWGAEIGKFEEAA